MSDPVSNGSGGSEALRGVEEMLELDLIIEVLTQEKLAELLTAPLEQAAAMGERGLAQRLVRAGAGIGDALHEAIRGGHGEIVSDLVESGAPLTGKNAQGRSPLHVAARQGETDMAQLLLLKGADTDAFDDQEWTPLYLAVYHGNLATTLALLTGGANVNLRCGQFKNPVIHIAVVQGRLEILGVMIEYGAGVDAVNTAQLTALHSAGYYNQAEAINVLLEAGANIEARDINGRTPLRHASFWLRREALLCLLRHGANVNARDNLLRTPLIHTAFKAGTQGVAEVVDSLLRAGADETIVDHEGRKASVVIGGYVVEVDRLPRDFERVRALLANAPADRAWRRRGYPVLCRARPDRLQQSQVTDGTHRSDTEWRTRSRPEPARAGKVAGDSTVDESTGGGDWAVVLSKVLRLHEEGIFRAIVRYL